MRQIHPESDSGNLNQATETKYETSMLHIAAKEGNLEVIEALITMGDFEINRLESKLVGGYAAIHYACAAKNLRIVNRLIAAGADVNIVTNSNLKETPLHICCKINAVECCKSLIEAGASTGSVDGFGHTPSFWAMAKKHYDLIQLAGLPPPRAATPKEVLEMLSQRCKSVVVIKPPGKKKKAKGKKGDKKSNKKKK
jgi:ankyrin repeat protein